MINFVQNKNKTPNILICGGSPKDLYLDNPVQAEGAARGKRHPQHMELRSSSTHYGVDGRLEDSRFPELRLRLARGYQRSTPSAWRHSTHSVPYAGAYGYNRIGATHLNGIFLSISCKFPVFYLLF